MRWALPNAVIFTSNPTQKVLIRTLILSAAAKEGIDMAIFCTSLENVEKIIIHKIHIIYTIEKNISFTKSKML